MNTKRNTDMIPVSDQLPAELREVLAEVPSADEDPTPRMMAYILEAESAAAWEDLFETQNTRENVGKQFRLHDLRQAPSTKEGSRLGFFLICDVTWLATGERDVLITSSEMGVAQLLNLYKRGDLPHDLEIVQKSEPTRRGFRPLRFRSLGKPAGVAEV